MTTCSAPLSYESLVGGALAPGEKVLWEGRPEAIVPVWRPLLAVAGVTLISAATLILAATATHGDVQLITLFTTIVLALSIMGVALASRAKITRRRDLQHAVYRITNQRIIRTDDRKIGEVAQCQIAGVTMLTIVRRRRPTITIDNVSFEEIADVRLPALRVLDLWAKSNRRRRVRRTPVNSSTPPATGERESAALPGEIVLAAGETILWSGHPRVREPIDGAWFLARVKTLAWLMIPTALLLASLGIPEWLPRPHWFAGAFAAFWLAAGLYNMTITPIVHARRRARTIYVLTSIRAIIHIGGRVAQTRSLLLDMVDGTQMQLGRNRSADVWVGMMAFVLLDEDEAARAHAIALDAIRNAGTPAGGIITPYHPDADLSI